jgi:hypothetical protein
MTRILSELLGANEPVFQQGIRQLESASGGANEDIRLTTEIIHGAKKHVRQLSLDPHDTTGRELYHALTERVRGDNQAFLELARASNIQAGGYIHEQQVTRLVERFIKSLDMPREVFALKPVAAKRLLRKMPPKKVMKQLGYRSLESLLKHEACALVFTAAHLVESLSWHRSIVAAYRQLSVSDFELRPAQILVPTSARWQRLAQEHVQQTKQNVVGLREFGAVILLPLPELRMEAAPFAVTLLAVQALNEIMATSTYLKLNQVRPDFGAVVAHIARNEPLAVAQVAGSALPWRMVHRYFARSPQAYSEQLFEPHVQQEDLRWHAIEDALAKLHPRFEFWQGTSHLGLLAPSDHPSRVLGRKTPVKPHEAVSLNITDVVLNFCNMLPYERRFVRYFREHVWNELMLRYMRQASIEQTVHEQLSGSLFDRALLR